MAESSPSPIAEARAYPPLLIPPGPGSLSFDITSAADTSSDSDWHDRAVSVGDLRSVALHGPLDLDLLLDSELPAVTWAGQQSSSPGGLRDGLDDGLEGLEDGGASATVPVSDDVLETSEYGPGTTLEVLDRLGQGGVFNAFLVNTPYGDAVLKLALIADRSAEFRAQLRRHVACELSSLRALAGLDCVPTLIGVWAGTLHRGYTFAPEVEEVWAVLTTYAGRSLTACAKDAVDLPIEVKEDIVAAYERIHAQGVRHGDPKLSNWTISDEGVVSIIDFSHASLLPEDEDRRDETLVEIAAVRNLMGVDYEGWLSDPYTVRPEE